MRKSRTLFLKKRLDNLDDKTKHPAVSEDENERNTVKSGKSLHVHHIVLRCLESNRVDKEGQEAISNFQEARRFQQ
jgi:hypothetical protein